MLRWIKLCVVVLLFSVISSDLSAQSRPSKLFDALQSRYLSLRNTDTQLHKIEEWRTLAGQFEEYADEHTRESDATRALLNAALLHKEIGRHREDAVEIEQAIGLLSRIVSNYPDDLLADDALFEKADLYVFDQDDLEQAQNTLLQIIESYSSSDSAPRARARLKELEHLEDDEGSQDEQLEASREISQRQREVRTVVIDPGHGGEDFGAVGVAGILEKDVVFDISREVARLLSEVQGVDVRLTRERDEFVPLVDRMRIANSLKAELFVSIHANSSEKKDAHGVETYYLDNTDDKASRSLADRENASQPAADVVDDGAEDLSFMLSDLIQNAKLDESIFLARSLQRSVVSQLSGAGFKIRDLGARAAPFYVLVGAHMPCALIEVSFIDHQEEGELLGRREYRRELSRGIVDGIGLFLEKTAKKR